MKSVSIVYKRSKTTRELSNTKEKPKEIRSAVDDYYTKLVEKGKNKEDIIEKIRSHTARASRLNDRKKVFSSLSIAAIVPPSPNIQYNKSITERRLPKAPLLNIKRATNQNFFTLNLPEHDEESA